MARTVEGPTVRPELGPCLDSTYACYKVPSIKTQGVNFGCARIVLEHALGRPLAPRMQANHHCDRPVCVRETHLYEGTHQENMDDCRKRNRFGPRSGVSRLTPEAAEVIFFLHARGVTQTRLAKAHGVSLPTVRSVLIRARRLAA